MKFELTEQERQILFTFLGRVQMTGSEVNAFNQVVARLNSPLPEKPEKEEQAVEKKEGDPNAQGI